MQRPASAMVFGILNIVFAVFGVFGMLVMMMLFSTAAGASNPVIKIIHENPSYAMWIKISIPLGLVSCAALLAAGIGLIRFKEWGRKLSLVQAIYALVIGVLGLVLNFFFVMSPLLQEAGQRQGPEAAGAIGGAIGGTVGGCFGMVYPILLLIFMTRPKLVAAFQGSQEAPVLPVGPQPM